jgi:hypothetical protein
METFVHDDFGTRDKIVGFRVSYYDFLHHIPNDIVKNACIETQNKLVKMVLDKHGKALIEQILKSIPTKAIAKLITKELKDGIKNKISKS